MKFFQKNATIIVSKIQICERIFVIHIIHRVKDLATSYEVFDPCGSCRMDMPAQGEPVRGERAAWAMSVWLAARSNKWKVQGCRELGQRRLSYGILVDLEDVWG